jgi:hypothetical protein
MTWSARSLVRSPRMALRSACRRLLTAARLRRARISGQSRRTSSYVRRPSRSHRPSIQPRLPARLRLVSESARIRYRASGRSTKPISEKNIARTQRSMSARCLKRRLNAPTRRKQSRAIITFVGSPTALRAKPLSIHLRTSAGPLFNSRRSPKTRWACMCFAFHSSATGSCGTSISTSLSEKTRPMLGCASNSVTIASRQSGYRRSSEHRNLIRRPRARLSARFQFPEWPRLRGLE